MVDLLLIKLEIVFQLERTAGIQSSRGSHVQYPSLSEFVPKVSFCPAPNVPWYSRASLQFQGLTCDRWSFACPREPLFRHLLLSICSAQPGNCHVSLLLRDAVVAFYHKN